MYIKQKALYLLLYVSIVIMYGFVLAFAINRANDWRHAESKEYLYKAKSIENDNERLILYEKAATLDPSEDTFIKSGIAALRLNNFKLAEKYLRRVRTDEGYYELGNAYYNLSKYDLAVKNYNKALNIFEKDEYRVALGRGYLKLGDSDNAKKHLEIAFKQNKSKELERLLQDLDTNFMSENEENDKANSVILAFNDLYVLGYPQSAENILSKALQSGTMNRNSLIMLANRNIENKRYESGYLLLQKARSIDAYYPQIYQQLVVVCRELGKVEEVKEYQEFYNNLVF